MARGEPRACVRCGTVGLHREASLPSGASLPSPKGSWEGVRTVERQLYNGVFSLVSAMRAARRATNPMATNYPYISSAGPIVKMLQHLRRSFPASLDADVIKKLGLAAKNESYLLNVVRFLGLIDSEGKKVDAAAKVFLNHEDEAFQKGLSELVKDAYKGLFDLHGDAAWTLPKDQLITFFRQSDDSSDVVGRRQTTTFMTLAAICGHAEVPTPKEGKKGAAVNSRTSGRAAKPIKTPKQPVIVAPSTGGTKSGQDLDSRVGLTVRIEINLPSDGSQEVYDNIFQSIRKNLIDGK